MALIILFGLLDITVFTFTIIERIALNKACKEIGFEKYDEEFPNKLCINSNNQITVSCEGLLFWKKCEVIEK